MIPRVNSKDGLNNPRLREFCRLKTQLIQHDFVFHRIALHIGSDLPS